MKKEYDFSKGTRGPVTPLPPGKTRITIRLDDDILAWFRHRVIKAGGGNYQTMINSALREYMQEGPEGLEGMLRRVVKKNSGVGPDSAPLTAYEPSPQP